MPRTPPKVVGALCAIVGGLMLNEQWSNNVLPLALHRFHAEAGMIGLVLAIHPLFGFLVQPVVGILGDRIWTPVGRRATFLVVCAPLAALCLALMAHAPRFWQYLSLVFLFQFFFAVLWGAEHPLLADLVPAERRTAVRGAIMTCGCLVSYLFMRFGVGWAMDAWGEASVYWIVAGGQIALVAGAALFLSEQRVLPARRPRLTPARYVRDLLGDPILRRFATLGFAYAAFINSVTGFAALYAVDTLHVSKSRFGEAWGSQSLICLVCALPLGLVVARRSKTLALTAGFALALTACFLALRADGSRWIYPIAGCFGLGMLIIDVTLQPFFSEYLPPDIIGQLVGAYNICYASGRIVALVATGWIVTAAHGNYRTIWIVAIVFGALAAIVAATIPDPRARGGRRAPAVVAPSLT